MGLSFKDSLKTAELFNDMRMRDVRGYAAASYGLQPEWTPQDGNTQYDEYDDTAVSTIDDTKTINLNTKQFGLTQEENSQYITFEMARFYDGFDLKDTNIFIHYVNSDNKDGRDEAVNVCYTGDKIRFGWLITKKATAKSGVLKFEIEAYGRNSKGDSYLWKTRPNNQLDVIESLSGNGSIIEPDPSWVTTLLNKINAKVDEAKRYADDAHATAEEFHRSIVSITPDEIRGVFA